MEKLLIRPSSIGTFLDCSARFRFQSIDRIVVPKALALAFGSAIHRPLEVNFKQKINTRQDLPTEQMIDEFSAAFEVETQEVEPNAFFETDKGETKDLGVRMISVYHNTMSPRIQPLHTELRFEGKLNDGGETDLEVTLSGQIDLIDSSHTLIDHKTTSRTPSSISEGYVLQQTSYKLLAETHGIEIVDNRIDYLIKKKQPEVKSFRVEPQKPFLFNILAVLIQSVKNETYVPNRTSMLCSRKLCSFWMVCEQKYGGRVKD